MSQSFTIDIMLENPCPTALITLNESPIVEDTYMLKDPVQTQSWEKADLYSLNTEIDCGPITVLFFNNDEAKTPLNQDIFNQELLDENSLSIK